MEQGAPSKLYEVDDLQNAEILALARTRGEEPQAVVREAIAKYLEDVAYEARRAAALAALKHSGRDNSQFAQWRGADIDGVEYQRGLR